MLYKLAHVIRDRIGFLWEWLEAGNSWAFSMRYGKRLATIPAVLDRHGFILNSNGKDSAVTMHLRLAEAEDAEALYNFFAKQPEEDFEFFKPHAFDCDTLRRLIGRTSFIIMLASVDEQIVGYAFLRSFVHGRSYLGKMVDHDWQGKGIGKALCRAAMDVALSLGVRMYESINKRNPASMRSSSVLRQVVVQELADGDLLIEDLPLTTGK